MSKSSILVALLALGAIGTVKAQTTCDCSGNDQVKNTLQAELTGSTFCVPDGSGWKWQEQHHANGELWDYKRGTSHATDPSKKLGTWAVTGTGSTTIVTHTYDAFGPAQSYQFKVCRVGSTQSFGFCPLGGGATVMATRKQAIGGCP